MIFVIIPVHNRINDTINCLNSLYSQHDVDLKVILVDDGSTDGTCEIIRAKFKKTTVLHGDGSLFWTGAVRLGIDYSLKQKEKNDWVLLMNNDTIIKDNKLLSKLINSGRMHNRKSLISPLTRDIRTGNCIETGTIVQSWFFNMTQKVNAEYIKRVQKSEIEVDFMTARCLLHPVEIFENIGCYNSQNFPHYGGDDEFLYRAKQHGYKCIINKNIDIYLNNMRGESLLINNWLKYIAFSLFDIRSSNNLNAKIQFVVKVVPKYAKLSYLMIAIIKSIIYPIYKIYNNYVK